MTSTTGLPRYGSCLLALVALLRGMRDRMLETSKMLRWIGLYPYVFAYTLGWMGFPVQVDPADV